MANPQQSRSVNPLVWLAGVVILILIVVGVRSLTREKVEVRVAPATFETLAKTASTNGKVEPVREFQAHAPFPGTIKRIFVQVGDHVSTGTLLMKMDDTDARARLATAESSLSTAALSRRDIERGGSLDERNRFASEMATARADQQKAASDLATRQALFAKGSASAAEVASAQQAVSSADLAVKSAMQRSGVRYDTTDKSAANARVSDARAAVIAAQNGVNVVNIRAPFPGTVYSLPVSEFDFVPAGDDVMDIADLNRIQVRAYFDEPEIGNLARGQAVKIVWDAKPGVVWHGHIERAPTTVMTYGTRNVGDCVITIDDAKGDLPPNSNVIVTVTEAQRFNVLSIPREALHTEGAKNFVFRIVNGKLVRATVQVGIVNLTRAEITSGLNANDLVVLSPKSTTQELTSGMEVKPVE